MASAKHISVICTCDISRILNNADRFDEHTYLEINGRHRLMTLFKPLTESPFIEGVQVEYSTSKSLYLES
jgi:hypothetical protein